MNQKVIYSMMGLAALPLGVDAAAVQVQANKLDGAWTGTNVTISEGLVSSDGHQATYNLGKLVKGNYTLTCNLTSKNYNVTVAIAGVSQVVAKAATATDVAVPFTIDASNVEDDVILTFTSAGESVISEPTAYSFDAPILKLNYDFAATKSKLTTNANALKTTIGTYIYDTAEDMTAVDKILTDIAGVSESYADYKAQEFDSDPNALQKRINELAAKAANSQAYQVVLNAISHANQTLHDATTAIEAELTEANGTEYLLADAQEELAALSDKINVALNANIASRDAGTAATDQATNTGKIPTDGEIETARDNWINGGQATASKAAYDALVAQVTDLQTQLTSYTIPASVASSYSKDAAQALITALNTKVTGVKNTAAQTTLDISADVTAAQAAIDDLKTKSTNAGSNTDKYNADKAAVAALQTALNEAKTAVNALKYGDTSVEAQYTDYVAAVQAHITGMGDIAKARFEALTTTALETAGSYTLIEIPATTGDSITAYKTNAPLAADNYAALKTSISSYQADLDAARAAFKDLDIYTDEGAEYNFKQKLDNIQVRINDITLAINAAMELKGAPHWTAMKAVADDSAITGDIAALVAEKDSKQLKWENNTSGGKLDSDIAAAKALGATYTLAANGADYATFQAKNDAIQAEVTAIETAKGAIDVNDPSQVFTSSVGTGDDKWAVGSLGHSGDPSRTPAAGNINGVQLIDQWQSAATGTGTALVQTLTDLPNGTYTVELYASAVDKQTGTPDVGKTDIAVVFANGVEVPVSVTAAPALNAYTINNVKVTNGTLELGLKKVKDGTCWHLIQIKSLTATTASLLAGWDAAVKDLTADAEALKKAVADVTAKVTANKTTQSATAASITTLNGTITTFESTYHLGTPASELGLKGQAPAGTAYVEEEAIKTALGTLETNNTAADPTAVTNADNTSKVDKTTKGWVLKDINISGQNYQVQGSFGTSMVEQWANNNVSGTGVVLHQTLTNLPNGLYNLVLKAHAADQRTGNPNAGRTDIVEVYANGNTQPLTVSAGSNVQTFTFTNILISDGTLDMGLRKLEAGTNWHAIQIESLIYRENANADIAQYAEDYTALAQRQNKLADDAVGIKAAVDANEAKFQELTNGTNGKVSVTLVNKKVNELKGIADVTDAAGVSTDAVAKKNECDLVNWKVFESDLATGVKNYTTRLAEITADIAAMETAIAASHAAETLVADWNDGIKTGVDSEGKDIITTIAGVEAAIAKLKADAKAESDNYAAYKALWNELAKCRPDTIFTKPDNVTPLTDSEIEALTGADAKAHYTGLKATYTTDRATLLTNIQNVLKGRTAVTNKEAYLADITALINKVKAVSADASANLKKYTEQAADLAATNTLYTNVYNEILSTDYSSKRDSYLSELDDIKKKDIDPASAAVPANFAAGESVAKAIDFAAIKAKINDVKARQNENYVAQIAADNLAAHNAFLTQKDLTQGAIDAAQASRKQYSPSNTDIADAVYSAAATFDAAIATAIADLAQTTSDEADAYGAVVSPTVYSSTTYMDDAETISATITAAMTAFESAVNTEITNYWNSKKPGYTTAVDAADAAIAGYAKLTTEEKAAAFKDVNDLIATGDAGVASKDLKKVEEAVNGLSDINGLLTTDKNTAANTNLTRLEADADAKYTEVKTYITGVANEISAKATELQNLEDAYADIADEKAQAKTFDNHNGIATAFNAFITAANGCKTAVETAVTNDNNNTEAYTDLMADLGEIETKLATAEELVAQYKYTTSLATVQAQLTNAKSTVETAKNNGYAYTNKATLQTTVDAVATALETTLTAAFGTDKTGMAADITDLKNRYNTYVAANGIDGTSAAYKTAIDELEGERTAAAIVDLDDPADGIDFDDIVAATEALIELQDKIANQQTTMGVDNATVKADFAQAISELKTAADAVVADKADWVLQQNAANGQKIGEWIASVKTDLDAIAADIAAEDNITFYKDQYQGKIDAVATAAQLAAAKTLAESRQQQWDDNAAAYAELKGIVENLQQQIDAVKEKVHGYQYYGNYNYDYYIESYNYYGVLVSGAQYELNGVADDVEDYNTAVNAHNLNITATKNSIERNIKNYLDYSAHAELENQYSVLRNNLASATIAGNLYSQAVRNRLVDTKNDIRQEIFNLYKEIYSSYTTNAGSFVPEEATNWSMSWIDDAAAYYYQSRDTYGFYIYKTRTSDADYADQLAKVQPIQDEIDALQEAIDNMILLGDANEDGQVNVLDYQKVAKMVLDPREWPDTESDLFQSIDINGSKVIEVGDLTAIVKYILDRDWQGWAAAGDDSYVKGVASGERLSMTASEVQGVQRFAINLQNVSDYTAFQLDVVLPEGMAIVGATLGERAGESHKLMSRQQLDGSKRYLVSSITAETFAGNDGAVLYFDVKTDAAYKGGSVEIVNALFSDTEAATRAFSLNGEATGVDTLSTFEALKQKVYDLSGRLTNGLKKGINIIRRADGSSQKVMK